MLSMKTSLGTEYYKKFLKEHESLLKSKRLFLIGGLPGVGKSFISKKLSRFTGGTYLSVSRTRRQLFKNPTYSLEESVLVYGEVYKQARRLIKNGKKPILDGSFTGTEERKRAFDFAKSMVGNNFLMIWVTAPKPLVKKRLKKRLKENPQKADYQIHRMMEKRVKKGERCSPPNEEEKKFLILLENI